MSDIDNRLAEIREQCEAATYMYIGIDDAKFLLRQLDAYRQAVEAQKMRDRFVCQQIEVRQQQLAAEGEGP